MTILRLLQQLLTTKATAVLAAFALIGGGAAIAAPSIGDGSDDDVEVDDSENEHDWALGKADDDQLDRIAAYCEENPEASFCSSDSGQVLPGPAEQAGSEEPDEPEGVEPDADEEEAPDDEVEGEDQGDTRSETAQRVHRALTGGDTAPGDPDFGAKVSARARSGGLGKLVSRAARGEDLDDADLELDLAFRTSRRAFSGI